MDGDFLESAREMFANDQMGYLKEMGAEYQLTLTQKTLLHRAFRKLGK